MMRRPAGRTPRVVLGLLALATLSPRPVRADAVVGTGTPDSCTEAELTAALSNGGNITFDCGPSPATITVVRTQTIAANTTVDGGGVITFSGGGASQAALFSVSPAATLALANLTIADAPSGAIFNEGTLTVTHSTFAGNGGLTGHGGAIYNGGVMTVTDSTFSGNSASRTINSAGYGGAIENAGQSNIATTTFSGNGAPLGGAIYNGFLYALTVTNSTFNDNAKGLSNSGGAIDNAGALTVTNTTFSDNGGGPTGIGGATYNTGTLAVANCTFSGNSAGYGGAINNGGPVRLTTPAQLTVTNRTFSRNSATRDGAAIANFWWSALLVNTLVVHSTAGENCFAQKAATNDGGHNLDDGTSCGFSPVHGSLNNTDPKLDPAGLKDNGGPTETIALEPGSPAINRGDEAVCAAPPVNNLDQRGYMRPGTGRVNCSIGAYEYTSSAAPAGDCNGDGGVTIDELLTMASIALGTAPIGTCAAGDANHDNRITVNEIVAALHCSLSGC